MKTKDLKTARNKDKKDLVGILLKKKLDLAKIQAKILTGKEKNAKSEKFARKEIAQLLTLLKEKDLDVVLDEKKEENKTEQESKKESKKNKKVSEKKNKTK